MAKFNYVNGKTEFINPYNFIPLGDKPSRNIDAEKDKSELHTGYFECTLTTKTPLAIPDTEKVEIEKENEHPKYPAFRLGNELVIPASSIRGPIRSVYETITNSCMVTMNTEEHITKRSDLGTFAPCVLKKEENKWHLYEAKRIPLVFKNNIQDPLNEKYKRFTVEKDEGRKYLAVNNQKIYFGEEVKAESKGPGHEKNGRKVWASSVSSIEKCSNTGCYLFLGEEIYNKHAESVFIIGNKKEYGEETIKKALKGLEDTLAMYRSTSINRNLGKDHYGYRGYEDAKKNGAIPLWYKGGNGKLYLSMAAIGRMAFETTMEKLSGNHEPCQYRNSLCPACSVFGMIKHGDDGASLGSRVRFTDAVINKNKGTEWSILKELGTPRSSYLPFYSTGGKEYDAEGAKIRGRKYYWHIPQAAQESTVYSTEGKTKRNSTMELIKPESSFKFKIYYDRLNENEIKLLYWAVTLGGNDTCCMHKLGHGKPLGLGSVKVKVDNQIERTFNGEYKVDTVAQPEIGNDLEQLNGFDKKAWDYLKNIAEFKEDSDVKICYPLIEKGQVANAKDNDLASHKWFSEFKKKNLCLSDLKEAIQKKLTTLKICEDSQNGSNYKVGDTYTGVVKSYQKVWAQVQLDDGKGKASFWDGEHKFEGKKVSLKYNGKKTDKNGKMHDDWKKC